MIRYACHPSGSTIFVLLNQGMVAAYYQKRPLPMLLLIISLLGVRGVIPPTTIPVQNPPYSPTWNMSLSTIMSELVPLPDDTDARWLTIFFVNSAMQPKWLV
jgi:hypothetical protein